MLNGSNSPLSPLSESLCDDNNCNHAKVKARMDAIAQELFDHGREAYTDDQLAIAAVGHYVSRRSRFTDTDL